MRSLVILACLALAGCVAMNGPGDRLMMNEKFIMVWSEREQMWTIEDRATGCSYKVAGQGGALQTPTTFDPKGRPRC